MRKIFLISLMLLSALGCAEPAEQSPQRFQWMSQDEVQSSTTIRVYIDRQTAECYAIYQFVAPYKSSAAFLGKVPCANVNIK